MRDFVINISSYAKNKDHDFIIIPQNGIELITDTGEHEGNITGAYLQAIDGVGQESLFYGYDEDNQATPEEERSWLHGFLDIIIENGKQVLVTDYCWTSSYIDDSYEINAQHGYVSFAADHRELDNIPRYPNNPYHEDAANIVSLSEAKNFLYLINPSEYPNKDTFIQSLSETNYDLILIDLFFNQQLNRDDISSLKTKANGGSRLIICYMSIGEAEDYRYYWQSEWDTNPPSWLKNENPDWQGNYKVCYWNETWQNIIFGNDESYLDRILETGFDGVYLDIIDAYEYFEST